MKIYLLTRLLWLAFISQLPLSLSAAQPQTVHNFATMQASGNGVAWSIHAAINYERVKLTISSDTGNKMIFRSEHEPYSGMLEDGGYSYELVLLPYMAPSTREMMNAARRDANGQRDAAPISTLRQQGVIPLKRYIQSGYFTILNGQLVFPGTIEE